MHQLFENETKGYLDNGKCFFHAGKEAASLIRHASLRRAETVRGSQCGVMSKTTQTIPRTIYREMIKVKLRWTGRIIGGGAFGG